MPIIEMKRQTCECVLDDDGKLIERIGDCQVDHVPEEVDTVADGVTVSRPIHEVVRLIEHEIKRLGKLDEYKRKRKKGELFKQTITLLMNCGSGFVQLANAIETLSKENERLKAELAQDQKRIIMP